MTYPPSDPAPLPARVDVIVLGAGAAGLFCAATAGARGRSVLVLEANARPGLKILVSGGGRANFTNREVGAEHYHSSNAHFARSALARFGPEAFVARVEAHGIPYHERDHGQLFCDESAKRITAMLMDECADAGVLLASGCPVGADGVRRLEGVDRFALGTPRGEVRCRSLVVATGGLSWPRLGVSDFGHRLARGFGLALVPPRPGLVPLLWSGADRARFGPLSGIAVPARVNCRGARFEEAVLFTHGGLSGPAVLQISNVWWPGDVVSIDWLPGVDLAAEWTARKAAGERRTPRSLLAERLPRRLADALLDAAPPAAAPAVPARSAPGASRRAPGNTPGQASSRAPAERPLAQCAGRDLSALAQAVQAFPFRPAATAGWDKAEVTLGGVDTAELSSRTLEARRVPGLHFIGEVVDVTGWLGGFNFQWAWASGHAAGEAV